MITICILSHCCFREREREKEKEKTIREEQGTHLTKRFKGRCNNKEAILRPVTVIRLVRVGKLERTMHWGFGQVPGNDKS